MSGEVAFSTWGNSHQGKAWLAPGASLNCHSQVTSSEVRCPSTEVVPPLNPRLKAAGSHPSTWASFHSGSHHPLFPAGMTYILGPLQNLPLHGQGRSLPACPLPQTEYPLVHPSSALLCAPWASCLLASHFAKAMVLAQEPPLTCRSPAGATEERFLCPDPTPNPDLQVPAHLYLLHKQPVHL